MMKILFLLIAIFSLTSFCSCCIHDKLQSNLKIYPYPTTPRGRLLEVQERENIRIHTVFYIDDAPAEIKKTIQQQIVPAAISYYQAALKVNPISLPLKLSDDDAKDCAEVFSTEALRNGVEADLILLVAGENKPNETYMAYAMACQQEETSQRPIIGMLKYNYAYSFDKKTGFSYQSQISTTLHEIGHVLGFSSDLYASYIDPVTGKTLENPTKTKEVNGVSITILDVEPLTSKLRAYFDCPTLEGAYLEQQGDSGNVGSHFERRVFYNEFLTAGDIIDPRISEFFLAVLEGSGWYTPDYTMTEPMFWGKGKGCEFLDTKCINKDKESAFPDHFCSTLGADSCTFGNQAYAMCGTSNITQKDAKLNPAFNYFGDNTIVDDEFSDNCPYYAAYSQSECRDSTNTPVRLPTGEYFGEGSQCFTGTLGEMSALEEDSPLCLKKFCQEISKDQFQVIVQVGNSTNVTCAEEGSIEVPGFQGVLNCPDPNTFCATSALGYCPRGCMGRGVCQNNKCVCKEGFYGSDCSYQTVKEKSEDDHKLAIEIGIGIAAGGLLFLGIVFWIIHKIKNSKKGEANEKCLLIKNKKGIKSTMIGENQFVQEKDRPVELNMEGY